jgi:hypothetical protein
MVGFTEQSVDNPSDKNAIKYDKISCYGGQETNKAANRHHN